MVYSYYPGCTLKAKAKKLDRYARDCAHILEIELEEIENWQCCGGVYPGMADELATRLSPVRALREAGEKKQDLVTVCSACHHVIKRVNEDMKTSGEIRQKINAYLEPENAYEGETKVIHYLELLRDRIGFDRIKEKVKHPLNGKKETLPAFSMGASIWCSFESSKKSSSRRSNGIFSIKTHNLSHIWPKYPDQIP